MASRVKARIIDELFIFDSEKCKFPQSYSSILTLSCGANYASPFTIRHLLYGVIHLRPSNAIANLPAAIKSNSVELFPPLFAPASPMFADASTKLIVIDACKSPKCARMILPQRSLAFGCILNILLYRMRQSGNSSGLNRRKLSTIDSGQRNHFLLRFGSGN